MMKAHRFLACMRSVPVLGVVLLVLYADKETMAAKMLSTKVIRWYWVN